MNFNIFIGEDKPQTVDTTTKLSENDSLNFTMAEKMIVVDAMEAIIKNGMKASITLATKRNYPELSNRSIKVEKYI